jgi:hypothetical protein
MAQSAVVRDYRALMVGRRRAIELNRTLVVMVRLVETLEGLARVASMMRANSG